MSRFYSRRKEGQSLCFPTKHTGPLYKNGSAASGIPILGAPRSIHSSFGCLQIRKIKIYIQLKTRSVSEIQKYFFGSSGQFCAKWTLLSFSASSIYCRSGSLYENSFISNTKAAGSTQVSVLCPIVVFFTPSFDGRGRKCRLRYLVQNLRWMAANPCTFAFLATHRASYRVLMLCDAILLTIWISSKAAIYVFSFFCSKSVLSLL